MQICQGARHHLSFVLTILSIPSFFWGGNFKLLLVIYDILSYSSYIDILLI
jgi:hypothetical protein